MSHSVRSRRAKGSGSYRYHFAGLRVAANRPLPALVPRRDAHPADLAILLGPGTPAARRDAELSALHDHPLRDEKGCPLVSLRRSRDGAWYELRYPDGTAFRVDREGSRVVGCWTAPHTLEDAATYLVGPVLAFALRRRGALPLHGAALEAGGGAVLVLGTSGTGKSTLAAALALSGQRVLCDDAALLTRETSGRFVVQPGSRWIRLWPDSVRHLFGPGHELPQLARGWDKRYFALSAAHAATPLPLTAIYLLEGEVADRDSRGRTLVLSARPAFRALLAHSYGGLLQDPPQRAREFKWLAELAMGVPVRHLQRAPVGELRANLERDLQRTLPALHPREEQGCTASFSTAR
jgi:hypothetical protein